MRPGTVEKEEIEIRDGNNILKFVIVEPSGPTMTRLGIVLQDIYEKIQGKDLANAMNDLTEEQANKFVREYNHLLLECIVECPDGQPADKEYIKNLKPGVYQQLIEVLVPSVEEIEERSKLAKK